MLHISELDHGRISRPNSCKFFEQLPTHVFALLILFYSARFNNVEALNFPASDDFQYLSVCKHHRGGGRLLCVLFIMFKNLLKTILLRIFVMIKQILYV